MSTESAFVIKEHKVEAQHIREYPRATAHTQEEVLYLAVKQYIPKGNPNPKPGDVTIIASHANGFVKELYEPLWEDLVKDLASRGVGVRGIWIADVAWQGQSSVLNEDRLGNDHSWFDHARDLLHMTNVFRASMPLPLVGVGHSFGAAIIANLALLHPRLLTALVLFDPVLSRYAERGPSYGFHSMKASSFRRDAWPSRAAYAAALRRNPFYATWDPRALAALVEHGVRELPTRLYADADAAAAAAGRPPAGTSKKGSGGAPAAAAAAAAAEADGGGPPVTLTTTKHLEVMTYYRPRAQGPPSAANGSSGARTFDPALIPDGDLAARDPARRDYPFYQPGPYLTTERLPNLRPGVLWVFGGESDVCPPASRAEKLALTGVGLGGSGGAAAGRVAAVTVEGYGHLAPMEATAVCAGHAAAWIAPEVERWKAGEAAAFAEWASRPDAGKQTMDEDFRQWIGPMKVKGPAKL